MRGVLAHRIRTAETTDRAAHESSVSRKTVAEVPLTGLSLLISPQSAPLEHRRHWWQPPEKHDC